MGNCLKALDPSTASILRIDGLDASPVKESGLPIIFLIGGPGAGKRTQCALIAERYGFLGIVSCDLLRDEVVTGTQRAVILAHLMSEGRLIPWYVLVSLVKAKMLSSLGATRGFLVSGFPREKRQCRIFDEHDRPPDLVLYLCVRNSLLMDRVLARTVTITERQGYSLDELKRRIKDFDSRNRPILRYYRRKLVVIDGERDEADVFDDICRAIDDVLRDFPSAST